MDSTNRPLVQQLINFKNKSLYSFHVPGHKNGLLSDLPEDLRSALSYDLTELEGLDDLHEAEGIIQAAQNRLATLYGSDQSFFLVNGSTVGNLAMIYAVCGIGDIIIVQRNAHKSIFNAIELTGARAVFIHPQWDNESNTAASITISQVNNVLLHYPEAKGIVLTYPSYYGVTGEHLEGIIKVCHDKKIPVLVDEAHGAHFIIDGPFPRSAISMGADVVVHSAHKTLPAMTMGSYLHIHSDFIQPEQISKYLKMLQSSSPSYLLMASLDDARAYAESYTEEDSIRFMKMRDLFIKELIQHPRITIIETDDPLKLMLRVDEYSGFDVQKMLDEVGIHAELADPYQVLFILPLLKVKHSYPFKEIVKLIHGVFEEINVSHETFIEMPEHIKEDFSVPEYTLKELERFKIGWMLFEHCVGMVSGATITPYPPGIPLLLPGERITDVHITTLRNLLTLKARFHGDIKVEEKQIKVVMNEREE